MPIKILVFESDAGFASELKNGFARLGCDTSVVDDANLGLQAAAREKPDLILLSIELPRMNGFSVCNKLKRDASLKDVPLVIMSSDSTEETFEQHRRLRTRAEDYVHKPISFDALLTRIQPFVPLLGVESGGDAQDEPVDSEAIVLDDDIEIEDAEVEEEAPEVTTSMRDSLVDQDVNDAFGALEVEIAPASIAPVSIAPASIAPVSIAPASIAPVSEGEGVEIGEVDVDIEEAEIAEPEVGEVEIAEPEIAGSVRPAAAAGESDSEQAEVQDGAIAASGGHAQVSLSDMEPPLSVPPPPVVSSRPPLAPGRVPSLRPSTAPRASELGDTSKYREEIERQRARIKELEDEARAAHQKSSELEGSLKRGGAKDSEVQRLQRELDEAKAKGASGGGKGAGSAREFLDLREQLNKKDKEILETKDQLSHKDKELIGLRDGAIALERDKADLHDRIAELEKQAVDLQKATDAAKGDKEQAGKRADDFKRKGEKTKSDLDAKIAELAEARSMHEAELSDRDSKSSAAVAAAEEAGRVLAEEAAASARAEAEAEHAQTLAGFQASASAAQAEAVQAREAELKREFDAKLASLHRANEDAMNRLRAEHTQDMTDAEAAAVAFLADREAELGEQHTNALGLLRAEKEQSEAARDAKIAALEAELNSRTEELAAAHDSITAKDKAYGDLEANLLTTGDELESARTELDVRAARIKTLEGELSQSQTSLASTERILDDREAKLAQNEAALAAARSDLGATQSQLGSERERVTRAHAKWADDRGSLERAKDALAAALAQIEEAESRSID
jgi:DNA-binding response OmpR family regulator/DNA repair exonuclease SbcCD ATPase subunit